MNGSINFIEWGGKIIVIIKTKDGKRIEAEVRPEDFAKCLTGINDAEAKISIN